MITPTRITMTTATPATILPHQQLQYFTATMLCGAGNTGCYANAAACLLQNTLRPSLSYQKFSYTKTDTIPSVPNLSRRVEMRC